jgi:hypothetical protein
MGMLAPAVEKLSALAVPARLSGLEGRGAAGSQSDNFGGARVNRLEFVFYPRTRTIWLFRYYL